MVKMEIMQTRRSAPAWINCKVKLPHEPDRARRQDLPGFRSHVRYSVFKDRRHVKRLPRGSHREDGREKRTGNLALCSDGVNNDDLR